MPDRSCWTCGSRLVRRVRFEGRYHLLCARCARVIRAYLSGGLYAARTAGARQPLRSGELPPPPKDFCSQCGCRLLAHACGPTHALMRLEQKRRLTSRGRLIK